MSLFERLDLTRHNRKLKLPLSERIDLTRPPRLRSKKDFCKDCQAPIQLEWEFCPACGAIIKKVEQKFSRHIWVDLSGIKIESDDRDVIMHLLMDAFGKLYGAFRGVNICLTSEKPDISEWGEDFTHVYIFSNQQLVDYLGVASFRLGEVTNQAIVLIDQVFYVSYYSDLTMNHLSNLIANTIAHEIGHTLGLDHSSLPSDVMHDGLDYTIHSLMPPSFHAEQINLMNMAIRRHEMKDQ